MANKTKTITVGSGITIVSPKKKKQETKTITVGSGITIVSPKKKQRFAEERPQGGWTPGVK